MARKTNREKLRDAIREELAKQLERNGTKEKYYLDLVDDYMDMWDTKNGLTDDIKKRGEKVTFTTASGSNIKTNDSVGDRLKVNAQMLKLLDSMGIKPVQVEGFDNDEM
ncbi:P27 family phage terminase small subunit [Agathobaculum sp. NTUH-O15-33]|uniref:P27 family phage terminase small subunit n=1 Tax=Agathobaculum sp. NTUH-O15-33 TaxID=3079302 RepID=UPI0029587A3D|nr:P27 family phage terminase small subunit [Agathobaculum sp. NTUH-O15-33]WNX85245.1 P27 family phage terminase small subunit [Agathobaculum sp. NTUH-O15-33]